MAGIGFELRRLLKRDSYAGLFQAYTYAGIISSGPWVLSIMAILFIGVLSGLVVSPAGQISEFQVAVTWLVMLSLILTGPIQLSFTRWIADRLFEHKDALIAPNFVGVLLVVVLASGVLGQALVPPLFPDQSNLFRATFSCALVVLSCIWVATIFLSGLKQYKTIVAMFALGYGLTVVAALALRHYGLEGLLMGFLIGQCVLLGGMLVLILRTLPSLRLIAFDFLRPGAMYVELVWVGLFFNLGVWADKLVFWFSPEVSESIIGPLRASVIYDLPSFLAYLSIIPGMAVFLVRIETDFVEYYDRFYNAVREGGSLDHIQHMRNQMVFTIRQGLYEILKIQGITVLLVIVAGPALLRLIGISPLYLPLLYLHVVAAGLQVVLLGVLNVFFYLDQRRVVLGLTAMLVVLNVGLTALSVQLGVLYFGYGVALAMMFTVLAAMLVLETKLRTLEFETFMMQ
ncbi:putative transmembrane protein [Leptothrix cholodnii SP-6]|uniref:Putative transmembrane protein n=1 Tax=Leptothrix cholodnii (strain ATCC 51168 / LMG 8142 / SP-6) TaxID=395495 RepID=B1Y568_LEPCP|nr:exopolysaccharide Pel transporter PelG [Leptothrix cholodnii]ACB32298.1 putative transmembrane protein [Leptothrix cholodnii SP-6]